VVGAVTLVLLVAMIVVGVLVAIKLTTDADIEKLRVTSRTVVRISVLPF